MKQAWLPEPWTLSLDGTLDDPTISIEDANGEEIAELYADRETLDVVTATARVIVAAPDLYAALEDVTTYLESSCLSEGEEPLVAKARAALAKVRGEA